MKVTVNNIAAGDILSETSHYIAKSRTKDKVVFEHLETGLEVSFDNKYVEDILVTADQYEKQVKVGKEDKFWTQVKINAAIKKKLFTAENAPAVGDLEQAGIRTLWENIYGERVFTVVFQKADEKLTKKEYESLLKKQQEDAAEILEKTATGKKGVKAKAIEVIADIQRNFISDVKPGAMRTLRGYKVQYTSRDGKYNCFDMDKKEIRPVNILTIQSLTIDGVQYILEK